MEPEKAITQVLLLAGSFQKARAAFPCDIVSTVLSAPTPTHEPDPTVIVASEVEGFSAAVPPEVPEELPPPPLGVFVISIQARSGFRRLHKVGECSLRPGIHYGRFRSLGAVAPSLTDFDARCKLCFKQAAVASSTAEESATSSGSSSESSSLE